MMFHQCLKPVLLSLVCASGLIDGEASLANQPPTAIVQNLTAGDRACYVELMDDQGTVSTQYAEFEICEQDLVGEPVKLTYEVGDIQAESCQGDPECTATEKVMLIIDVEPLE